MFNVEAWTLESEEDTLELGASLVHRFSAGDLLLLQGPLGAGKTTLVRGFLAGLGWNQPVRSPSFNLLHEYQTDPQVLHADLYRLDEGKGLGLEDYWDSHLLLVEWPERFPDLFQIPHRWVLKLEFHPRGRLAVLAPQNPAGHTTPTAQGDLSP